MPLPIKDSPNDDFPFFRFRPRRNDTWATAHRFPYTGLLRCAACGCAITAEIKKDRYVYYYCTLGQGSCGGLYVREPGSSGTTRLARTTSSRESGF